MNIQLYKIHSQINNWSIDAVIKSNSSKLMNSSNVIKSIDNLIDSSYSPVEHAHLKYSKVDLILLLNELYEKTNHRIDIRVKDDTHKEFLVDFLNNSKITYDNFESNTKVTNDDMKDNRVGIWSYSNKTPINSNFRIIVNSGYKGKSVLQLDINII